ncbi:hypothetical protein, partial [Flavobacterium sp.]|uniref:hypothetical protein n=1 Tax=Flavobacterium sp. TaxID=239 RepID=UPI0037BFF312
MIKIFVYAAHKEHAEKAVQTLKSAGAEHVELLESLKLSTRQPRENRYLFICESPTEKLATLVQNELPESQYAEELGQWYTSQAQILEAYHSHKKRALLISTSTMGKMIAGANKEWSLNLNTEVPTAVVADQRAQSDKLLAYLVQTLIKQTPPLQQLTDSIAQSTGEEPDFNTESEAIASYRNIKSIKSGYKQELETIKCERSQLQNIQEESELHLLQLHQVQEQLERIYLEYQAFKEKTENEKAELTAARDHRAHVAEEREQVIDRLNAEKAELTAARDQYVNIAQEREQVIDRLNAEKAELAAARDYYVHITQEREQEIGSLHEEKVKLVAAIEQTQAINQNLEEESELLLMQLHQVQEELERNFLFIQESKTIEQTAQARWERLFKTNPKLFDYDTIDTTPIEGEADSYRWVIKGLVGNNISKSLISFETFIERGVLGIRFHMEQENNSTGLTRWLDSAMEDSTIEVIPTGNGKAKVLRARTLRDLSASDWKLSKLIPDIILKALPEQRKLAEPINKLKQGLNAFPEVFRYDIVKLKKELKNPDYEHLWLVLENASFGKYYWPELEIRIGAANINKETFSEYPKIEIPLINKINKPFDSWFEESIDDFGGKYELRFDLK